MSFFKRSLYLGYYIKQMDWNKLSLFLNYTAQKTGKSKVAILADVLVSLYTYNISILEYFQFRFFEKNKAERAKWAGTGYMYEYQLVMNPPKARTILDNKRLFYDEYRAYFVHKMATNAELLADPALVDYFLASASGKIVLKAVDGKCGAQVHIKNTADFTADSLLAFMNANGLDLIEEFIVQHPTLNQLSPSGVNTVRIFTQVTANNEVEILGCRQRITVNSSVDNMAAGNVAAPIDETTGIINGPAVYSDITKPQETSHPITKVPIVGFQVPFWPETIEMVKKAALAHPQNRSIGWDIVITEKGPGFIEGNHDWCKLLWQLPEQEGLKHRLEKHWHV